MLYVIAFLLFCILLAVMSPGARNAAFGLSRFGTATIVFLLLVLFILWLFLPAATP
jgi:hypothetical protein